MNTVIVIASGGAGRREGRHVCVRAHARACVCVCENARAVSWGGAHLARIVISSRLDLSTRSRFPVFKPVVCVFSACTASRPRSLVQARARSHTP